MFGSGFLFKIFFLGFISFFGLQTPEFIWGGSWPAGTSFIPILKMKSDTILADSYTRVFFWSLISLLKEGTRAILSIFFSNVTGIFFLISECSQWSGQNVNLSQLIFNIILCLCIYSLPSIIGCWLSYITSNGASILVWPWTVSVR